MFDLRGYIIFATVIVVLLSRNAGIALVDCLLLLTIVGCSKDGPALFGHLGRRLNGISFLRSPAGAAMLMALPVKTLTALLGAADSQQLSEIALHATIGIAGLGLCLGVWPTIEKGLSKLRPLRTAKESRKASIWLTFIDLAIVVVLLAAGKDGQVIFGSWALWLQEHVPVLSQPWARGLIAVIPVKTFATLRLAGSAERRMAIASYGSSAMVILAMLTFPVFITSGYSKSIALMIGFACCFIAAESARNFADTCKQPVR